jgi:tetratricopeptide (TPR) repeat protein
MAWDALGVAHSRLGERRQAMGCYRQGLALVRELKNPFARAMLASMLAEFGDACQAAGDPPADLEAWRQALQVLDDLGWPDLLGVGARLEQAGAPSPPG